MAIQNTDFEIKDTLPLIAYIQFKKQWSFTDYGRLDVMTMDGHRAFAFKYMLNALKVMMAFRGYKGCNIFSIQHNTDGNKVFALSPTNHALYFGDLFGNRYIYDSSLRAFLYSPITIGLANPIKAVIDVLDRPYAVNQDLLTDYAEIHPHYLYTSINDDLSVVQSEPIPRGRFYIGLITP